MTARGLPDDCQELTILRSFRDNYLLASSAGKELVAEYYTIAPSLCRAIAESPLAAQIWEYIYREVVHKTIVMITQQSFAEASNHYRQIVYELKSQFAV